MSLTPAQRAKAFKSMSHQAAGNITAMVTLTLSCALGLDKTPKGVIAIKEMLAKAIASQKTIVKIGS